MGKLFVIDGTDGSGKQTQLETLKKRLADEKIGESDFYITADCDGQYSPEDIEKVAKEL